MVNEPSDPLQLLAERVTELEALFTHLSRTLQELDGVVVEQQKQIAALERKLAAFGTELGIVRGAMTPELKPEDEKPPHY